MNHDFVAHQTLVGLWKLQHGKCAYCPQIMRHPDERVPRERVNEQATIDHMQPIARGGNDDETNRVAACARCNRLKGNLDVQTFLRCRHNEVMLAEAHRRDQRDVPAKWRQGAGNQVRDGDAGR